MKKILSSFILLFLVLLITLVSFPQIGAVVKAEPKTIVVPDDFPKIADAVDNATDGDTIFVKKGTYEIKENLVTRPGSIIGIEINKTLSIIGEDQTNTIIVFPPDTRIGFPRLFSNKYGFYVNEDNFRISNLTITNCDYGISLHGNRAQISNIITTSIAIHGNYCNIFENSQLISDLFTYRHPVYINGSFNNFVQNTGFSIRCKGSYNYWDGYSGLDSNGDGIGDTPHIMGENSQDNYPLMAPITFFDAGTWEWVPFNVDVVSNSTVSDFSFNPESALIRFNVDGKIGTTGFCRVTIPKDLLNAEGNWIVLVDRNSVSPKITEGTNNTYLYFTYKHSTKTVEIIGTDVIPEFPSWAPLLIMLVTVMAVAYIYKQKLHTHSQGRRK